MRSQLMRILAVGSLSIALAALALTTSDSLAKPPGKGGGGRPNYEIVPLDNLDGTLVRSVAYDINNYREVVGFVQTGEPHSGLFAAVWEVTLSGDEVRTTIHSLPDTGYRSSWATGINDSAEVVGYADTDTTRLGLYWPSPTEEPLVTPPLPGDNTSFALEINADGVICGGSARFEVNPDGSRTYTSDTPVVWQAYLANIGGVPTPVVSNPVALPIPAGTQYARVRAINDADGSGVVEIAGRADAADGTNTAVIWTVTASEEGLSPAAEVFVLGAPAEAYGINNRGEVSGVRLVGDVWEGTVWSGGSAHTLGRARFISRSRGRDINDAGVVVGEGDYSKRGVFYTFQAAVWPSFDADMILLDSFLAPSSPFSVLTNAEAVNEGGDIVGYGWTGENRAYVAIPR